MNLNGDIELVPRVGNHTILLGDASRLEVKFRNLRWFYREALNKKGVGNTRPSTLNTTTRSLPRTDRKRD